MTRLEAGSATDVGLVRANNQDQMLLADPVYAVADGMGGHAAGEVAAQTAVEAFGRALEQVVPSPTAVIEAVEAANRAVWDQAQGRSELRGMGTTLTAVVLVGGGNATGRAPAPDDPASDDPASDDPASDDPAPDDPAPDAPAHADPAPDPASADPAPDDAGDDTQIAVVNVGDSRTYRLRGDDLVQVTVDHSYVAELVADGRIDEAEAEVHPQRHVLTRALGVSAHVDVDLVTLDLVPGDRYLLCSDGLSREVSDRDVAAVLRRLTDPRAAARQLVADARRNGGSDNITVVVVDVVADHGPADSRTPAAVDAGEPTPDAAAGSSQEAAGTGPATLLLPVTTPGPPAPSAAADQPAQGPAATATGAPGPPSGSGDAARPARMVTGRVVAFLVALVAVVVVAAVGTSYYARHTYYVGLQAGAVTVFQGRPGGVLWWKPTVAQRTNLTAATVLPYTLAGLRAGVQEPSLGAAHTYIANLRAQAASATTTTVPPPTTAAPTLPPTTAPSPTTTTRRHRRRGVPATTGVARPSTTTAPAAAP